MIRNVFGIILKQLIRININFNKNGNGNFLVFIREISLLILVASKTIQSYRKDERSCSACKARPMNCY